jgi:hypothetical protein
MSVFDDPLDETPEVVEHILSSSFSRDRSKSLCNTSVLRSHAFFWAEKENAVVDIVHDDPL